MVPPYLLNFQLTISVNEYTYNTSSEGDIFRRNTSKSPLIVKSAKSRNFFLKSLLLSFEFFFFLLLVGYSFGVISLIFSEGSIYFEILVSATFCAQGVVVVVLLILIILSGNGWNSAFGRSRILLLLGGIFYISNFITINNWAGILPRKISFEQNHLTTV
jgi:hypothetical protein